MLRFSPLLDLTGADTKGFEALDSGTYPAEVFEVTMKETKGGEDAKLPKGTPMMNVQFRIVGEAGGQPDEEASVHNRRVFNSFIIAPEKVDGKKYDKKAMFDGMLVRFFVALGYTEEEVMAGGFEPDFEDMKGRACRVSVAKREYPKNSNEFVNDVKGVKPPADGAEASGLL